MVEAAGIEFNGEENNFSLSCVVRHKCSVNKEGCAGFDFCSSPAIMHHNARNSPLVVPSCPVLGEGGGG